MSVPLRGRGCFHAIYLYLPLPSQQIRDQFKVHRKILSVHFLTNSFLQCYKKCGIGTIVFLGRVEEEAVAN